MTAGSVDEFLAHSEVIDWRHPAVMAKSRALRGDLTDDVAIARRCFEWVRDEIKHSSDFQLTAVTCAASEVLQAAGFATRRATFLRPSCARTAFPRGSVTSG